MSAIYSDTEIDINNDFPVRSPGRRWCLPKGRKTGPAFAHGLFIPKANSPCHRRNYGQYQDGVSTQFYRARFAESLMGPRKCVERLDYCLGLTSEKRPPLIEAQRVGSRLYQAAIEPARTPPSVFEAPSRLPAIRPIGPMAWQNLVPTSEAGPNRLRPWRLRVSRHSPSMGV